MNNQIREIEAQKAALTDSEMANVSGGSYFYEHIVDRREDVRFIFNVGDEVYVDSGLYFITQRCKVVQRDIYEEKTAYGAVTGYKDIYMCKTLDSVPGDFSYFCTWISRDDIVMG